MRGGDNEEPNAVDLLRVENQKLKEQVAHLADANVHAAELLAALEESHEREQALVQRGEELELQTRLDLILQDERDETRLLDRVAAELRRTESLQIQTIAPWMSSGMAEDENSPVFASSLGTAPRKIENGRFSIPIHSQGVLRAALEVQVGPVDFLWCDRWLRFLWSIGRQIGGALHRLEVANENLRINVELRKARDEALESSRIKSAFLANMSHELRTPMNVILGYSEMLIEDFDQMSQDSIVEDLGRIHSAGKHLLSLINDVLDLSRIEAGKMTLCVEPFRIDAMVAEAVAAVGPAAQRNGNQIDVICGEEAGVMTSDLVKVRQTLLNLLSNAVKFTSKGRIAVEVVTEKKEARDRVRICVTDTGIGMTEQEISRLFQDFVQADSSTTRKYGGSGLGLSISRRFCRMLGGDIYVESTFGAGSKFTIDLPKNHVEVPVQQESPSPVTTELHTRSDHGAHPLAVSAAKVLVIDDNQDSSDIIRRALEKDGHHVVLASSGEEGIDSARRLHPDAIMLDVRMPGLNGWQVLAALKADKELNSIPVVLLSVVENREIGMALGAVDCLPKPIDWDRLAAVLDRHTRVANEKRTILVVEDEPHGSELVRRLLKRTNWLVETAQNGMDALAKIGQNPPSLIVLDLMMPVMDGFAFVEELRSSHDFYSIPIVVLTGKSLTPEDHRRLNGQVEAIMHKGLANRSALLDSVKSFLKDASNTFLDGTGA